MDGMEIGDHSISVPSCVHFQQFVIVVEHCKHQTSVRYECTNKLYHARPWFLWFLKHIFMANTNQQMLPDVLSLLTVTPQQEGGCCLYVDL